MAKMKVKQHVEAWKLLEALHSRCYKLWNFFHIPLLQRPLIHIQPLILLLANTSWYRISRKVAALQKTRNQEIILSFIFFSLTIAKMRAILRYVLMTLSNKTFFRSGGGRRLRCPLNTSKLQEIIATLPPNNAAYCILLLKHIFSNDKRKEKILKDDMKSVMKREKRKF
mmetsp:Transcript_13944/g.20598  ORF Transcript_13944/g.20598 Transcript_13944/m.20598 type:complete len:169 (+) Transcript_13944:2256-2762(+)